MVLVEILNLVHPGRAQLLQIYMYCGRHSERPQGFSDVEDVKNSAAQQENDSDVSNDLEDLQMCHN